RSRGVRRAEPAPGGARTVPRAGGAGGREGEAECRASAAWGQSTVIGWQTGRPSLLDRRRDPADAAGWGEFDRMYGELIVRYCRGRGLQLADAEDVRQIVLWNLSKAMPGFRYSRERGRFRDYLGRAVRNAIWRRRPGRVTGALEIDEEAVSA